LFSSWFTQWMRSCFGAAKALMQDLLYYGLLRYILVKLLFLSMYIDLYFTKNVSDYALISRSNTSSSIPISVLHSVSMEFLFLQCFDLMPIWSYFLLISIRSIGTFHLTLNVSYIRLPIASMFFNLALRWQHWPSFIDWRRVHFSLL